MCTLRHSTTSKDVYKRQVVDNVHTGEILVDGLGVGDVGNIVLRDRQHLAEDGIMIVVLTLEKGSNQLLAGPDLSLIHIFLRENDCDKYYQYNKKLLFDKQQEEILSEMDEIEQDLNTAVK